MSDEGLDALFEAAKDAATAATTRTSLGDGSSFVLVPDGYRIHTFGEPYPPYVRGSVCFSDVASFCEYVNAYKGVDGTPLLLADVVGQGVKGGMSVSCILDYHNPASDGVADSPRMCTHRAEYVPVYSEQYLRWRAIDEKAMSQAEFAEFIEEFYTDIAEPAPATMMEIASDLEMSSGLEFKSKTNVQNGMVSLQYVETGKATTKQGGEVPKVFRLNVPVFFGEEPSMIEVFLRFRVSKTDGLRFAIKIRDRETLEKERFIAAVESIGKATELTPLVGKVVNIGR